MAGESTPTFIRPREAVDRFGLSRSTFDRALTRGELTRHKKGSATLLELAEVEAWIRDGAQRVSVSS